MLAVIKKSSTFALEMIGLWCNGNTADSGPAFPGSSPGSPTKEAEAFASAFLFATFIANYKLIHSKKPR